MITFFARLSHGTITVTDIPTVGRVIDLVFISGNIVQLTRDGIVTWLEKKVIQPTVFPSAISLIESPYPYLLLLCDQLGNFHRLRPDGSTSVFTQTQIVPSGVVSHNTFHGKLNDHNLDYYWLLSTGTVLWGDSIANRHSFSSKFPAVAADPLSSQQLRVLLPSGEYVKYSLKTGKILTTISEQVDAVATHQTYYFLVRTTTVKE